MTAKHGLTERIRALLRAEAKECPTCGHMDRTAREMAKALGIPVASLWRFMSGRAPSAALLDKLYARYEHKLLRRTR